MTVFFATSPHWPGIVDFLFSAYSGDAKEEITTCKRFESERIRILKCIYMSYLYMFHTLTFRFSVCNSIINLYETHYSCKKRSPSPTRKITNTTIFRIKTTAICDRECYISCEQFCLGVCLQKKQDGRRGKNADGQIENNGASTPVLFSP